jgi:hypothetical protein
LLPDEPTTVFIRYKTIYLITKLAQVSDSTVRVAVAYHIPKNRPDERDSVAGDGGQAFVVPCALLRPEYRVEKIFRDMSAIYQIKAGPKIRLRNSGACIMVR